MRIYIVNIVLLAVFGLGVEIFFRSRISRLVYCIYAWLQMTIIAAIRFETGLDYTQYHNTFYKISRAKDWSELLLRREEIGYIFCNRLISYVSDNIIVFMLFYYGLMFGLLLWYIYRYSEVKWISVVSFIAFDYFAMSLCFMRQGMAMVIGLYALEMMKRRKWVLVILLTILASLFHSSALILLFCFLFSYINLEKKSVWITSVLLSVGFYFSSDFILQHALIGPFKKYADYLDSPFMMGNHFMVVFYPIFCFGLMLVFRKQLWKKDPQFRHLLFVIFIGVILSLLSTKHYIIERMALYITFYNIRVVSMVVGLFQRNGHLGKCSFFQPKRKASFQFMHWNYALAIISTLFISASAFLFGIQIDRYRIVPYKTSEYFLYECNWFKGVERKSPHE